jgi:hypothetical protein
MIRTSVAELPAIGHPTTVEVTGEFTEINTLLPGAPPNWVKVCCVIVVWRSCESMNVVGSAFPFQRIWDCGTNSLPFTVRTTESAVTEIALGDSNVIWGVVGTPRQLLKPMIAVQVQPGNVKVKAAAKPIRRLADLFSLWKA